MADLLPLLRDLRDLAVRQHAMLKRLEWINEDGMDETKGKFCPSCEGVLPYDPSHPSHPSHPFYPFYADATGHTATCDLAALLTSGER